MKKRTWTEDQLRMAVKESRSLRETLLTLNLAIAGGSYVNIRRHIERLQLNTSHWNGQSGAGRLGKNKQLTLEDILKPDSPYPSHQVRLALLKSGVKENRCEQCNAVKWHKNPITIQLHHRNGIRNDNRLENLQMLCPNCHSQK
jgi:hypothetical protein